MNLVRKTQKNTIAGQNSSRQKMVWRSVVDIVVGIRVSAFGFVDVREFEADRKKSRISPQKVQSSKSATSGLAFSSEQATLGRQIEKPD